jgi:hypothetical protein
MIRVTFEPPDDKVWHHWRKAAQRSTDEVKRKLAAGEKVVIDGKLYKRPRDVFLRATHDKCAYCEVNLTQGMIYGDVEHYRPKGRITDDRGRLIMLRRRGEPSRPHPGYPWLAYDPSNLLPSCIGCNRPNILRTRERIGKWDQFPVERFRAREPGEETREKPLLLHPVLDDPADHLTLQLDTGVLVPKTPRGECTIEILGLNRDALVEARHDVVIAVWALVVAARTHLDNGEIEDARAAVARLEKYRDGSAPFAWAGRLTLDALGRAATP